MILIIELIHIIEIYRIDWGVYMNSKIWNHLIIRFLVSFASWEVLSFPIKMLFFSKFYYSTEFKQFFVPMIDIYWIIPAFADIMQIFVTGFLYYLAKHTLPEKYAGGFLFGLLLSGIFASIALLLQSFTTVFPIKILWIWFLYEALMSIIVSVIYSADLDS